MLANRFRIFLAEQDPPFPCGIHEGWLECDGGSIAIKELEKFLKNIRHDGFQDGQAEKNKNKIGTGL